MPRIAPLWTALPALLGGLALACGPGQPDVPAPPQPDNLAEFDPRVVARIQEARAQVEAEPRRAQAWAELGLVYVSERLKTLALECFGVAARLEPRQPKWPYREAITQAQIGELGEAVVAMERSLALEPGYAPSHARLGGYRLALGDLDGAALAFRQATVLDSSYPGGWVGLARVALQREDTPQALEILGRLCQQDPEDRTFRQLFVSAQRQAGGTSELSPESVLGDEEVPVWNDPWELEARAFREKPAMLEVGKLLQRGKPEEALTLLDEQRARGADASETALSAATALLRMGRDAEALREIEGLLAREPENSTALLMKAQMLDDAGDLDAAVELLERVTTLQPTFGGAFAAKAAKLAQQGFHEPAVAAFQRARELGVDDYELCYSLGQSLIVLKRWPEALELFGELVEERDDHGDAWLELAVVRLRSNQLAEAEQALERARATGNTSPRLLEDVQRSLQGARERRARKSAEGGSQ